MQILDVCLKKKNKTKKEKPTLHLERDLFPPCPVFGLEMKIFKNICFVHFSPQARTTLYSNALLIKMCLLPCCSHVIILVLIVAGLFVFSCFFVLMLRSFVLFSNQ